MKRILFIILTLSSVTCGFVRYETQTVFIHGTSNEYRVYGAVDTERVKNAVSVLKPILGSGEYIYSVWEEGNTIKVNTVMGKPVYKDGNSGFSYTLKKENGIWVPHKESGQWVS